MVLLDYIANKGVRIPREGNSDAGLWAQLRVAAQAVGAGRVFPDATQGPILDDHVPFLQQHVSSIDLIDFSYPYRDTTGDTVGKLSVGALDAVGETVAQLALALGLAAASASRS
jgi:glutaminyl-peptide cyclotransferase